MSGKCGNDRARVLSILAGHTIPVVGLGVYLCEPGAQAYEAVLSALRLGYRHIDTAQVYGNESDVGRWVPRLGPWEVTEPAWAPL